MLERSLRTLHAALEPRAEHSLVHGEFGLDHPLALNSSPRQAAGSAVAAASAAGYLDTWLALDRCRLQDAAQISRYARQARTEL